jgi:hypothetical protein
MPTSAYYSYDNLPFSSRDPHSPSMGPVPFIYGGTFNDLGEKNNYRMTPYHRFDLGIQFHKPKKWGERVWEISVYNVYNRMNPFFYYNDTKTETTIESDGVKTFPVYKQYGIIKQVSLFPIIPSVTYSFKF